MPPPSSADVEEGLSKQADEWRVLAGRLDPYWDRVPTDVPEHERGTYWDDLSKEQQNERRLELVVHLSNVRWDLDSYLSEGGRIRRTIWLRLLVDDLALVEGSTDIGLAAAASGCRRWATELSAWIQHTDKVIIERLVARRSAPSGPPPAGWWRSGELDAAVATFDPMSCLISVLDDAHRAVGRHLYDPQVHEAILNHLARSLGALRNELRAGALLACQLKDLIHAARDAASSSGQ